MAPRGPLWADSAKAIRTKQRGLVCRIYARIHAVQPKARGFGCLAHPPGIADFFIPATNTFPKGLSGAIAKKEQAILSALAGFEAHPVILGGSVAAKEERVLNGSGNHGGEREIELINAVCLA